MTDKQRSRIVLIASIAVLIFAVLYAIPQLLAGPSEPIFTIVNEDEYPHSATFQIVKSDGTIHIGKTFNLEAGESIKVSRQTLESNNTPKMYSELLPPEWNYCIKSGNRSLTVGTEAHFRIAATFTLTSDSDDVVEDVSGFT